MNKVNQDWENSIVCLHILLKQRRQGMKKEIIIDGKTSDWFEKATFVLKENSVEDLPKDLMHYAEQLVENHMKKFPIMNNKALPSVDFTHDGIQKYQQLQRAYNQQVKKEYEKIKKEAERVNRRARYVNTFVTLSIIACLLSIGALIFSSLA